MKQSEHFLWESAGVHEPVRSGFGLAMSDSLRYIFNVGAGTSAAACGEVARMQWTRSQGEALWAIWVHAHKVPCISGVYL